jgi:hypothetical protein
MSKDVFISYSQPDHSSAFELVEQVEAQGISCWIAPRDIAPSADWAAEIIDAISNARTMILVFSGASNDSSQVRREVERAVHKGVSILPFRIEDVLPSKSLEYFLSSQHWMDAYTAPREVHYARLCAYLKSLLSAQGTPLVVNPVQIPQPQTFEPDALKHVERQLAAYIGPLAGHLVKTTSKRASGIADLVARLAPELDTEAERHEFTRRCRADRPA